MSDTFQHITVLPQEAAQALVHKPNGFYVDCTFGRGGHTALILEMLDDAGSVMAIDKDPDAIAHAGKRFEGEERFDIAHGSFAIAYVEIA